MPTRPVPSRRLLAARRLLPALALLAVAPAATHAQSNSEGFWRMRFNFNPPGARASALGGSFIGLADDATAAESNPAGLTVLLYPQVSVEGELFHYRLQVNSIEGSLPEEGPYDRSGPATVFAPTFLSAVMPTSKGTISIFRHELVNYRNALDYGFIPPSGEYVSTTTAMVDVRVANTGIGFARRLGSRVSVGVAGGISSLALRDVGAGVRRAYGTIADYSYAAEGSNGRGNAGFVNVGGIVRFSDALVMGAVYKYRGAVSGLVTENVDITADEPSATPDTARSTATYSFDVPDAVGIGFSGRPSDRLTWSVDAQLIQYSQLTRWLRKNMDFGSYAIGAKDGVDVRGGLEYIVFVGRSPLALRGGAARVAAANFDLVSAGSAAHGESHVAGTFGIGSVLSRRLQLDAAAELSRPQKSATVSLVYFFGRR